MLSLRSEFIFYCFFYWPSWSFFTGYIVILVCLLYLGYFCLPTLWANLVRKNWFLLFNGGFFFWVLFIWLFTRWILSEVTVIRRQLWNRDFWRRHRRKVFVTAGVLGGGYLLYKLYNGHRQRLADLEKELESERQNDELIKAQLREIPISYMYFEHVLNFKTINLFNWL